MKTRVTTAVALAVLVAIAGAGVAVGAGPVPNDDTPDDPANASAPDGTDRAAQYKVSLQNLTVETWLIRNSTVRNASIDEVVVRNATTVDGATQNVTLTNASVGRFVIDRGRLTNVTARTLVVRNRSVLDVPGGDLFDPNVQNRVIERHWTQNQTVSGVVIDRIVVDAAVLCGDATLGQRSEASRRTTDDDRDLPAITVQNGTVEEALVIRGEATDWSVGSIERSEAANASLPDGCDRG
ncbi:hypothetical protein [Halorussus marinus]|uniref:hypothetical protein n=1 Tax=Halorussus marinus TaxID=2505976 RepID=UPI001092370F|nr:hypothetical protein [Halorussus marinus]